MATPDIILDVGINLDGGAVEAVKAQMNAVGKNLRIDLNGQNIKINQSVARELQDQLQVLLKGINLGNFSQDWVNKAKPEIERAIQQLGQGLASVGGGKGKNLAAKILEEQFSVTPEVTQRLRNELTNVTTDLKAQWLAAGQKTFAGFTPDKQADILRQTGVNPGFGSTMTPTPAFTTAMIELGKKTTNLSTALQASDQALSKLAASQMATGLRIYNGMTAEAKMKLAQGLTPGEFGQQIQQLGAFAQNPATYQQMRIQQAYQRALVAQAAAQARGAGGGGASGGGGVVTPPPGFTPPPPPGTPRGGGGGTGGGGGGTGQPAQSPQNIMRIYQRAAQMYQLGNILNQLGLPGGQQVGIIGSAVQSFAPTALGLTGGLAVGGGLAALMTARQAIADSVNAFIPVEQQFMRIQTLTQTSKGEVKNLGQEVRKLSVETGVSQEDLAKSLYYISSSGFKGNDAFTILNATVKASAAGLGDVSNIADIVTSMMNAYGIKASGAFSVTDKLITAIREGKAEPEQFARSLGQVLPIAREAGIGLDEVLSAVSSITLQGFSAPQAITSVRQALANLVSPSKEAAKELDLFYGAGKGVQTVQLKLATEGFQATLQDLYKNTGGNLQSLDAIFGNIRGLSGVLALANGEFKTMDNITRSIANSSGVTRQAFSEATETTQSQIKKMEAAWNDLKIKLGEQIAPIIIPFVQRITAEISLGNRAAGGEAGFAQAEGIAKILEGQINAPTNFSFGGEFVRTLARIRMEGNENPYIQFLQAGGYGTDAQSQLRNRDLAESVVNSRIYSLNQDRRWFDDLKKSGILPTSYKREADLTGGAYADYMEGRSGGGGIDRGSPASTLFITQEKDRFNEAVAEWGKGRAAAIAQIEKLNLDLAKAIFAGLDQMQARAEGYDSFFSKLAAIDKKLAESPDFIQVYKENGKATTLSAQQKEDEKIRTLRNQISIEEQKNLIREARKPSKDPQQNVLRGLQDKLYDDQLDAKKQQLSDLEKGQASRSTITVQNEQDKKALEERRKLLEEYDKQTYELVKSQFQAGLVGSADDPEGFNFLLKNGGDLLSRFATNAGLFKTSGFAAAIAEAALQMKFLRGPDGKYLKGEEFAVGFGEYSDALEKFRGKLKDFAPFLSGDQKMTIPIAVDMKLVPAGTTDLTNVGEVRRRVTGGGERDEAGKRIKSEVSTLVTQGIDVTTPQGQVQQLMKNMGFTIEEGLQASFKINMQLASPDLAKDVDEIKTKLKSLDELKNGIIIPVGLALRRSGIEPGNLVDKDNKATLQQMFDDLLPKEGEQGKNDIKWTVPLSLVTPKEGGVNTKQVDEAIVQARKDVYEKWKDQRLEAITNIETVVDVAQVTIQNSETMRLNYIRAIENALKGYFIPGGGGGAQGYAAGGWEEYGGMRKVGELGPEYLYIPKGGGVIPANIVNAVSGVSPRGGRDSYIPETRQSSVVYFAPENKTYLNYSIDARGAQEPKRTREAVSRALKAADVEKLSRKRARETGGRTF